MILTLMSSACLLALAPAQDAAAVELLSQMGGKLLEAETLQVEFKADAKSKGAVVRAQEGKIVLQAPNNLYVKIDMKAQGKTETVITVCDGTSYKVGDKPAKAPPEGAAKNYRSILMIMGLSAWFNTKAVREVVPKVKDQKLGRKETVNGIETQQLMYTIDLSNPDLNFTTTVWVDLKTHLPVRRNSVLKTATEELLFSETLGAIKADEKIDPKLFTVPK